MSRAASSMSPNLGGLTKSSELRQRIFFVIFALIVFRLGSFITLPGIDPAVMSFLFEQQRGSILDMFNMFSGGALSRIYIRARRDALHICFYYHSNDDTYIRATHPIEERR